MDYSEQRADSVKVAWQVAGRRSFKQRDLFDSNITKDGNAAENIK